MRIYQAASKIYHIYNFFEQIAIECKVFFGYLCIPDLTPRHRRIVAFMQINRIWKNKSPWGPDNRRLAEIVKLQVKLFPLSLVITCAKKGCSDIAISNSAYVHEIESLPLVLYVEVVWTLIPREACVYLCLSVCACMCVCVWACVYVIQGLLSQVWPRVTCLLCPRRLESRGLVPPPAKNTPGLHTVQGRIHPYNVFRVVPLKRAKESFSKLDAFWVCSSPIQQLIFEAEVISFL